MKLGAQNIDYILQRRRFPRHFRTIMPGTVERMSTRRSRTDTEEFSEMQQTERELRKSQTKKQLFNPSQHAKQVRQSHTLDNGYEQSKYWHETTGVQDTMGRIMRADRKKVSKFQPDDDALSKQQKNALAIATGELFCNVKKDRPYCTKPAGHRGR